MSFLADATGQALETAAKEIVDRVSSPAAPTPPARRARRLPGRFQAYSRSGTLTAAGPLALDFDSFGSGKYGLTRIAASTAGDPRGVLLSLSQTLRGRRDLLEPVSVHCIRRLFERPLGAALLLARADRLRATVEAADGAEAQAAGLVSLTLAGLTDEQLDAAQAAGLIRDVEPGGYDDVVLLSRTETVDPGASSHEIEFLGRGQSLEAQRIVASCGRASDDLRVTLTPRAGTADLLPPMTPDQLAQLFTRDRITPPIKIDGDRPFSLFVDNPTALPVAVSVVVEAYRDRTQRPA